ncbi:hypothetical protein [Brunnivagina elsteri]|uniref:hypothetical protein n=1 Tax=Brunnivagina elsteri TaxID=1247191 RepID=UPI0011788D8A|nr:hypothetical protein [Calothrix elsteri]
MLTHEQARGENMPTVYLKSGEVVEVPIEELADYLYENEDKIQLQKLKSRRGPIRSKVAAENNPAA